MARRRKPVRFLCLMIAAWAASMARVQAQSPTFHVTTPPPVFRPLGTPAGGVAGPKGDPGLPAPASPVVVNVKSPPFPFSAAVGDGVADDTVNLQAILLAAPSRAGGWVYIPAGQYKISSPLVLCNPGAAGSYTSVQVLGDGEGSQGGPNQPGTTLVMNSPGQDCDINVAAGTAAHPGQLYHCEISKIFLLGYGTDVTPGTAHGIHWTGTGFNGFRVQQVQFSHFTSTANQVDAAPDPARPGQSLPTSTNGENLVFEQCVANYCRFLERTAGQAYGGGVYNSQGSEFAGGGPIVKDGYAANGSHGGFGLLVQNFSGSFNEAAGNPAGINNANIAFDIGGEEENAVFERCRVEHCAEFLHLGGGSVGYIGHVAVRDCTFTDLTAGGGNLLHRAGTNAQTFVRITDCNFQSPDSGGGTPFTKNCIWPTQGADYGRYTVEGCVFSGYSTVTVGAVGALGVSVTQPDGTTAFYAQAGLTVKDCYRTTPGFPGPMLAVTN